VADFDRTFETYDLNAGTQIAVSAPFSDAGIPMRRVPGTDDFITNSGSAILHLFRVGATGAVVQVNESRYFPDLGISTMFTFDLTPALHVIQENGSLLKIYGDQCSATNDPGGCFVKDGVLGTLAGYETFVAMADDGKGSVLGLVASNNGSWFDGPCGGTTGCSAQKIDVANRLIVSRKQHVISGVAQVVAAKADPDCGVLYVGFLKLNQFYPYDNLGYRVEALTY
jgi:hypothetical protein